MLAPPPLRGGGQEPSAFWPAPQGFRAEMNGPRSRCCTISAIGQSLQRLRWCACDQVRGFRLRGRGEDWSSSPPPPGGEDVADGSPGAEGQPTAQESSSPPRMPQSTVCWRRRAGSGLRRKGFARDERATVLVLHHFGDRPVVATPPLVCVRSSPWIQAQWGRRGRADARAQRGRPGSPIAKMRPAEPPTSRPPP